MSFTQWFKIFFENEESRPSMTRLLCFISIFPASYVVVSTESEGIFGWYVSAYVLGYVGGKATELLGKPNQNPPSTVQINQPEKVNVA